MSYATVPKRVRKSVIRVGACLIGGEHPILVQSMTNTPTSDVQRTGAQIRALEEAGVDIIRVSCPDEASTAALKVLSKMATVPLIADIHFHYKRAIEAAKNGASALRINPGNIGSKERIKEVVRAARDYGCSMRIGVNGGSLEKPILEKYRSPCADAMVESALFHVRCLEELAFREFKISVKSSQTLMMIEAYRKLSALCDYPLHLGVTEAGSFLPGSVKSAIGIGTLLSEGIGDTIRVSLCDDPVREVEVGFEILKALNLRRKGVCIVACPSCARQGFDVIETVRVLESRLRHIRTPMTLSVLGCVVNGPGEAREADVGLTGGGAGVHMLYLHGLPSGQVPDDALVDRIVEAVEEKARLLECEKRE